MKKIFVICTFYFGLIGLCRASDCEPTFIKPFGGVWVQEDIGVPNDFKMEIGVNILDNESVLLIRDVQNGFSDSIGGTTYLFDSEIHEVANLLLGNQTSTYSATCRENQVVVVFYAGGTEEPTARTIFTLNEKQNELTREHWAYSFFSNTFRLNQTMKMTKE